MDEEHNPPTPPPMPDRPGSMPPGPPTGLGGGLSEPRPSGPAPGPMSSDRLPALLTVAGGVLVVLGSLLPVVKVSAAGATSTVSGTSAGIGVLILGGFAIVKGLSGLSPRMMPVRFATPLLTGGLLVVLLVLRWNDIQDAIDIVHTELPGAQASVGIGYWIDVVGTVLILVAGFMDLAARRRV